MSSFSNFQQALLASHRRPIPLPFARTEDMPSQAHVLYSILGRRHAATGPRFSQVEAV